MKPLPESFTLGEFTLTLVARSSTAAIYKQSAPFLKSPRFEVIQIKFSKEHTRTFPDGRYVTYEASERYPSNDDWGKIAWSYSTIQDAQERFSLVSQETF